MKNLIKYILITIFSITFANGEIIQANNIIPETHQVIVSTTKKIDLSGELKKEEIFFGNMQEYSSSKDLLVSAANGALSGLNSVGNVMVDGAKAGVIGLGVGLVVGTGMAIAGSVSEDKKYILIYDIENQIKEKTRVVVLFVSNDFDNKETIKNYLLNKEVK